jgi:hypothetical protein
MKLHFIEKMTDQLMMDAGVLMVVAEEITNIMAYDSQVFGKISCRSALDDQLIGLIPNKKKVIVYDVGILKAA